LILIDDIEACMLKRERVHHALVAMISEGREYNLEYVINPADGSPPEVIYSTARLEKDAQGTPLKVTGFIQDITERKQMEEAKNEALNRLQKIASRVPGVVYQYRLCPDGSSCFPFASEGIREIYRVSPEEVREDASKVFANHYPDDYDGIRTSIQKSARHLTPWCHEYRVKFDDGTVHWLFGNALPQQEADGVVLWHGFITDITERKQAEEELHKKNAEIEQFIYPYPMTCAVHWLP
jgi:PAS domain S-box-containing protein